MNKKERKAEVEEMPGKNIEEVEDILYVKRSRKLRR